MEFQKPKTSRKTSCFLETMIRFSDFFEKILTSMFFDDTLQNTKRYRWCDDGFGHRKRKEKLWKLWKEHSWKVELVVCNVYKKVK